MATINYNFLAFSLPYILPSIVSFVLGVKSFYYKTNLVLLKKFKKEKNKKSKVAKSSISLYVARFLIFVLILSLVTYKTTLATTFCSTNFSHLHFNLVEEVILYFLIFSILFIFNFFFQTRGVSNDYQALLLLPVVCCLHFILSSQNFVSFTFLIEVVGYFFYFQFLAVYNKKRYTQKKKRGVDLILFYYWSSFISSVLIIYVNLLILLNFNTTDFFELNLFSKCFNTKHHIIFLLLSALIVKFGVLGLHLFKLELYKYLRLDHVFNYTVFAIFAYIVILHYLLKLMPFVSTIGLYNYSFIFLFFGMFVFTSALTSCDNILAFFGYSGVLTGSLCFLLIL